MGLGFQIEKATLYTNTCTTDDRKKGNTVHSLLCVGRVRTTHGLDIWEIWQELIIIIIIIKKDWQCKAGRGRLTPYQSEDPSSTLPTYIGKEEKMKIVEDKKGESN